VSIVLDKLTSLENAEGAINIKSSSNVLYVFIFPILFLIR